MASELEDVRSQLEQAKKQKGNSDKNNRALEEQLNGLRGKVSSLETKVGDYESKTAKQGAEMSALNTQLEEAEHKLGLATKNNKSLESALSDAKSQADDESKVRIFCMLRNYFNTYEQKVYSLLKSFLNAFYPERVKIV